MTYLILSTKHFYPDFFFLEKYEVPCYAYVIALNPIWIIRTSFTTILHQLWIQGYPSSISDVDWYVAINKLLDSILNLLPVLIRRWKIQIYLWDFSSAKLPTQGYDVSWFIDYRDFNRGVVPLNHTEKLRGHTGAPWGRLWNESLLPRNWSRKRRIAVTREIQLENTTHLRNKSRTKKNMVIHCRKLRKVFIRCEIRVASIGVIMNEAIAWDATDKTVRDI